MVRMSSAARLVLKLSASAVLLIMALLTAYSLYLYPRLPRIDTVDFSKYRTADTNLRIEEIPADVVSAFIAAEDKNFFAHSGVDYGAVLRAIKLSAQAGRPTNGASTITMQLSKKLFLGPEKTLGRKLSEIMLAKQMEKRFSKSEILEIYLNSIYFGNASYGLKAASNHYFNKPLEELDLSEIAVLAGIPKAPSIFNPTASPSASLARRNWVLERMRDNEFIDQSQFRKATSAMI